MGQLLSFLSNLFGRSPVRMLILGLDSAGKTTLLYRIASGETIKTVPTIGFNIEELTYQQLNFKVWDLGGQETLRPYWKCYYPGTNAIIFVIDSVDADRMEVAARELHFLCSQKELANCVVAIFANKQDLKGAMPVEQIAAALRLADLKHTSYAIFPTSAVTGDGIDTAMQWIASKCR